MMKLRSSLAILISLLLVYLPTASAGAREVVGKIQIKGMVEINGAPAPPETTIFAGDRIATANETATGLSIIGGDKVFLSSFSTAAVQHISNQVQIDLERGAPEIVVSAPQNFEVQK